MGEKRDYTTVDHEKPYRFDEDGLHVTRGCGWSAPGCHLGCGVLLFTDDNGKLVKVEGDPENPFNQGRLCVRCLDLPEVVYSPDRILHPMKRDPKNRGKNQWEQISWDVALDEIAGKILEAKEEYGPESVAFYSGTGRDIGQYITRLCWGFNSPNFVFMMSGQSCYSPRVAGCFSTSGSFWVGDYAQQFPDRYDNPNWEQPDLIVIWGNNPIISNSDGLYGHWVVDCMKRGTKAIVVDPRLTWLASRAELFLQIRPGTDGALALGMVNYLIENDLYDHEFVDLWCYGFDELAERAREYPLDEVAAITEIPADEIAAAARRIGTAERAILQWGVAIDQIKETIPTAQAVLALFEITGNIGKPGTMQQPASILNYAAGWGSEFLTPEQEAKRIGQEEHPLIKMGFQECVTDDYIKCLETGTPYPIKVAWMQTTNPLACTGVDAKRTLAAHMNIDTIVCVDLFMTPTAMALADYFLPACTYAERNGLRIGDGAQRAETINKAIEPLGESRSDMQICLDIGKRISPEAWPWDTVEDMYSDILEETGHSFEEMQELAPGYPPFDYRMHEKGLLREDGNPGFQTATGRIELWCTMYNSLGLDPLPSYEEPVPSPRSTPELFEEYPLVLTTGARVWSMFHSEHRQIPRMRALHPEPLVYVNPATAAKYGVKDGDWVWLENMHGRCKRQVRETPIVNEHTINTDHAWWRPEAPCELDEGLYDLWDLTVENLLPYDCGASGFGANYKNTICKMYPVAEGA
ncbi:MULTISPECIES: molybdopterin-dependent oxidoreductase [Gordonibacter]|uniref:Molybdopterin-dependent oxidoreductase n=1 Tax=Gordonibacter faecis TaxID=3047475 RepID=A0ABT7DJN1_9ACTN|nr:MULTISPECIES: molybdopterin-dependent oxidoreductase [unclassified Gordonibacter]MDJ1649734.1 molybdopterin-dependent oxidoreductase [Gordonibacter sp. KGMB12511]HIW76537.1 molybdopterin-dependent oxidoreductase [Candidatus Gordonibacter avicola]